MEILRYLLLVLLLAKVANSHAQANFTANDKVPAYNAGFRLGTNLGGMQGKWMDLEQATIAAGSEALGIPGAGCTSLRLPLPNHFLERWGYPTRTNTFKDYTQKLGMSELTVYFEGPSDENIDKTHYCLEKGSSKMFRNMYEPIWDNGENGTPVNDSNPMALYVYKTAIEYGETVRFWEVWNEPDYTTSDKGWQPPTSADNWWIRDPAPCELYNLLAPVQHYIRALRIAYEIIKYVDPNDFICIGGVGYESFLDAVLRNTDNPDGGKISTTYPLKGGAYFDCLSYHSYPMYGTREYIGDKWVPQRHSDKAIEVFLRAKTNKEKVLHDYGYDGTQFPKKRIIVTETNVPRKSFDGFIGSEAAQYNYLAKVIIKGQQAGIDQIHTYALTDSKTQTNSYNVCGFYPHLEGIEMYKQKEHLSAVATRNVMEILEGYKYAKARTQELKLPSNVDGTAFVKDGEYIYALWAKTKTDNSEQTSATYAFPVGWSVSGYTRYEWNYTKTKIVKSADGGSASLNGSPSFFVLRSEGSEEGTGKDIVTEVDPSSEQSTVVIFPNPSSGNFTVEFSKPLEWKTAHVFDITGRSVHSFVQGVNPIEEEIKLYLPRGIYIFKAWREDNSSITRKLIAR